MTSALELAALGYDVTLFETMDEVGGRARLHCSPPSYPGGDPKYCFDAGPSWYWMPDVFEAVFDRYNASVPYPLTRLDPAYRVFLPPSLGREENHTDVPGTLEGILEWATAFDPYHRLDAFFADAGVMYAQGVYEWIWKPMISMWEMLDVQLAVSALFKHNMLGSFERHLAAYSHSDLVTTILKWPVMFIGASPKDAPAMYALMTFGGHVHGTWVPQGGMSTPAKALGDLASARGVTLRLATTVSRIKANASSVTHLCHHPSSANNQEEEEECTPVDGVVGAADYHFVEQTLLPSHLRRYSQAYWDAQVLSPACRLYFVGVNASLSGLLHHTFFFDVPDLDASLDPVFAPHVDPSSVPGGPAFYVNVNASSTPDGDTTGLFILIPSPYTQNETRSAQSQTSLLSGVLARIEARVIATVAGVPVSLQDAVEYVHAYGPPEFSADFHAFRGNAFGHANILSQSLILKPSMDGLADNMVFAGHLTNPGPGVPPAMVSGIVAASVLDAKLSHPLPPPFFPLSLVLMAKSLVVLVGVPLVMGCMGLGAEVGVGLVATPHPYSYGLCVLSMFAHGKTYFAAASLFDMERFFDTAAMYALFRAADDCVDATGLTVSEREEQLSRFIATFWSARRGTRFEGRPHPELTRMLPAILNTVDRRGYTDDMFDLFFKSMAMDIHPVECRTQAELDAYMAGSAAVMGDFMLPILLPDRTTKKDQLLPFAQSLGRAMQMTNFIRDVDEDLDLDRKYLPTDEARACGVDLGARDPTQPGWPVFLEQMLERAEAEYARADEGISQLPLDVRPAIATARDMYSATHRRIRGANYDVFSGRHRLRLSGMEKVARAWSRLTWRQVARLVGFQVWVRVLSFGWKHAIPLLALCLTWATCAAWPHSPPDTAPVTYAQFHLVITVPLLFLVWGGVVIRAEDWGVVRTVLGWTLVLCVVATVYTTPWDNYLVYRSVWGYPPGSVIDTWGYVPVEEYAFFSLETLLVGGLWLALNPRSPHTTFTRPPTREGTVRARVVAVLIACVVCVWGVRLALSRSTEYLGLLLAWSAPVLGFQWAYGAGVLVANMSTWVWPVVYTAGVLCVADAWAIGHGVWAIAPSASVGDLVPHLPVEEAVFFVATSAMCATGLTCAMAVSYKVIPLLPRLDTMVLPSSRTGWVVGCVEAAGYALVMGVVGVMVTVGPTISYETQVDVVASTSLFFGLSHGALDPVLMMVGLERSLVSSLVLYVGGMGVTWVGWMVAPMASLVVFILLSVFHFGEADVEYFGGGGRGWWVRVFVHGGVFLGAMTAWPSHVAGVFAVLLGSPRMVAEDVVFWFSMLKYVHAAAVVVALPSMFSLRSGVDVVLLVALFATTPPLLAFAVYFNGFHAPRHVIRVWAEERSKLTSTVLGICGVAAVVAVGGMAWVGAWTPGEVGISLRSTFVGLSVLATPHMVLVATSTSRVSVRARPSIASAM